MHLSADLARRLCTAERMSCDAGLAGGASGAAAGLLHPFSPRGRPLWMAEAAMPAALRLLAAAQAVAPGERFVWDTQLLRPAADEKQVRVDDIVGSVPLGRGLQRCCSQAVHAHVLSLAVHASAALEPSTLSTAELVCAGAGHQRGAAGGGRRLRDAAAVGGRRGGAAGPAEPRAAGAAAARRRCRRLPGVPQVSIGERRHGGVSLSHGLKGVVTVPSSGQ